MRLEIDSEKNMLRLDGVDIALEALWWIVHPDPRRFYQFERQGDRVLVNAYTLESLSLREDQHA